MTDKRINYYCITVVIGIIAPVAYLLYFFEDYSLYDPYYYVQLARNIAEGRGYTTSVITPLSWSLYSELMGHAEFWKPPLYPFLVASGFVVFGQLKIIPILISVLSFLGSGLVLFRITETVFDSESALFGALFFLTASPMVLLGIKALTESLYVFLMLVGILVVIWPDEHPFLLGVISALAYMTRFNHWFIMIGLLLVACSNSDRSHRRYLGIFCAGFFIFLLPWMSRNIYLVGNPFFHLQIYELISHTPQLPQFTIFLSFDPPNLISYFFSHFFLMIKKWLWNLDRIYHFLPRMVRSVWLVVCFAFFSWGLKDVRRNPRAWSLLTIFSVGFLLQALLLSFVHVEARYFTIFLPVVFIFAGKGIGALLRDYRFTAVVIALAFLGLNFGFVYTELPSINVSEKDYAILSNFVPQDEPIVTNIPEFTAYYGERYSLLMPPYRTAKKHYPEFNFVYYVREHPREFSPYVDFQKYYLKDSSFKNNFELVEKFSSTGNQLYVRSSYLKSLRDEFK